jgi:hypothetical protein
MVTVAGIGREGLVDGNSDVARLNGPAFLKVAEEGVLFVTEIGNHTIRKITIE